MVKTVSIEIEGMRPLLEHQMVLNEEVDNLTKTVQKNSGDMEAHKKLAEIATYKTKDGKYYIPSEYLEGAFTKAGASQKIPGRGNKTYKDIMKGQIMVDPDEVILDPQSWEMDLRFVKIGMARIPRARPRFKTGWKTTFNIIVMDDTQSLPTIKEIIEEAGKYIGIGDFRPKYGLFKVNSFTEIDK